MSSLRFEIWDLGRETLKVLRLKSFHRIVKR